MKGKVIGLLLVLFVLFVPTVKAANNKDAKKCDYKEKAEKRKLASNVKVAYDIKQRDDGTYYVEIFIYNITDDLYVGYYYKGAKNMSSTTYVFPLNTKDGTYSFIDDDIINVKKYYFDVRSKGNCTDSLKSLTLTKPKYNLISDIEECKYFDVEEYMYCQKWITRDFGTDNATIVERIHKQRLESINMRTTECLSCKLNDESNALYERMLLIKKIVIIALSLGIVVDIVVIIILRNRIKEARFI